MRQGLPLLVTASVLMAAAAVSCVARNTEQEEARVDNSTTQTDSDTPTDDPSATPADPEPADGEPKTELATFGAGCFWCVEAVFQQLRGVISVESGYSGGSIPNPTYQQVCTGTTGHAEVCQIRFNPAEVSYKELLEVFWKTHDPTTLNRQGADTGTQYRSVVFYHNDEQRELAEKYKRELDEAKIWSDPIVTEISPFGTMYKAEDYHQNYFRTNPYQGYCRAVIQPKVDKFRKVFEDKLKEEE
jgi:peptide-methionine (S)-S-oxide reductase